MVVGCGRSTLSRPRAAVAVVVIMIAGLLGSCSLVPIGPGRPSPTPTSSSPAGSATPSAQPETGRPIKNPPQIRPNGFAEPPSGKGLDRYRGQRLKWTPCGSNKDDPLECASVLVPLDYKQPDKTAITLSMARRPATMQPKLGTLFINPGGPGASGVDYVNYFDRSGLDAYDIVGWDPRGIARSTPVTCFSGEQLDVYTEMDMSPDNDQEDRALQDSNRKFGESCLQQSGRPAAARLHRGDRP